MIKLEVPLIEQIVLTLPEHPIVLLVPEMYIWFIIFTGIWKILGQNIWNSQTKDYSFCISQSKAYLA
jgi:hypothetical protein